MGVKLILFDLDGTLLTSRKTISLANMDALERCVAKGIHIVPSTGRFYDGMPQPVRDLPFVRYVVLVNGAQVFDAAEDKVLHRAEIPVEQALRVYDALDRLPVIYDCFLDGWGYMDRRFYEKIDAFISDERVGDMVKRLRRPVEDLRAFLREQGRPLQKLQMFFADMDARARALEELPPQFPEMAFSSSITNNIECNIAHATKGEALRFLCRHLRIDVRDTMAFGDGSNDRSMIEAAGIGVAMANADEALKAVADDVTDTNDRDGVARALEKYCLSE